MTDTTTEETAKADEAFRKRNWKDAEDSFQRILTRVPEHVEALHVAARMRSLALG